MCKERTLILLLFDWKRHVDTYNCLSPCRQTATSRSSSLRSRPNNRHRKHVHPADCSPCPRHQTRDHNAQPRQCHPHYCSPQTRRSCTTLRVIPLHHRQTLSVITADAVDVGAKDTHTHKFARSGHVTSLRPSVAGNTVLQNGCRNADASNEAPDHVYVIPSSTYTMT